MSPAMASTMKWDCQRDGCFNKKKRLKFSAFDGCLPGKIAFTDVDGLVEIAGNFLFLEWKDHRAIPTGQSILYKRLTENCPACVLLVEGDAEDMSVKSIQRVWQGAVHDRTCGSLDDLRGMIKRWAGWARANPAGPTLTKACVN